MKKRVLFLSRTNTCRTQMAEGLLRHMASDLYDVESAGTTPGREIHPLAIQVMNEIGVDLSTQRPRHIDDVRDWEYSKVIALFDKSSADFSPFPGEPECLDWNVEDPSSRTGTAEMRLYTFRRVREEIRTRLCLWKEIECRVDRSEPSPSATSTSKS